MPSSVRRVDVLKSASKASFMLEPYRLKTSDEIPPSARWTPHARPKAEVFRPARAGALVAHHPGTRKPLESRERVQAGRIAIDPSVEEKKRIRKVGENRDAATDSG